MKDKIEYYAKAVYLEDFEKDGLEEGTVLVELDVDDILNEIDDSDIEYYASRYIGMIDLGDLSDKDLISELEDRSVNMIDRLEFLGYSINDSNYSDSIHALSHTEELQLEEIYKKVML